MSDDTQDPTPSRDFVESINVADEMSKSFLDYSMSVIISRALPDARDGLKPRKGAYFMRCTTTFLCPLLRLT